MSAARTSALGRFFILAALLGGYCHAAFQAAGVAQLIQASGNTADFSVAPGALAEIQIVSAGVARVRFAPNGAFTKFKTGAVIDTAFSPPPVQTYDYPATTYIVSSQLVVVVIKSPFQIVVLRPDGSLVSADIPQGLGWDDSSGLVCDVKYALTGEHYFGLGLLGGPLDRRGRGFLLRNTDNAGYTDLTTPLYSTTPFFYGANAGQCYGLFLDNSAFPFFDFDSTGSGKLLFGAYANGLDYYVFGGPQPAQIAADFATLTGHTPLPPKWTLGFHQSRYGYQSWSQILSIANQFRALSIPCDSLYFDIGYMNNFQMFTWDPVNFANPVSNNATLDALGFKRVNIVEPCARSDDPLFAQISTAGHFLKDASGADVVDSIFLGNVAFIDFSRTDARAAQGDRLRTFLQTGVSAVWNDLNEPANNFMPQALYNFDGSPVLDFVGRNLYALQDVQVSYQAQKDLRPDTRPWVISRSGFAGIQRYSANWGGDEPSTWDALKTSIHTSNSMGLSGQNFFGHDIGGFLGSPSAELFIRWMETSSMTPLFRNHATNTSGPREPWAFGEPYTSMARNIINQRYALLPYVYSCFEQASRTGTPVLAPVFFNFPGDANTYTQNNEEFMLGTQFLVAPVFNAGATTRTVYLPAGSGWFNWYDDTSLDGGNSVTVNAPLGRVPLFVRAGALIPSTTVVQHTDALLPTLLTFDSYPGNDTQYLLYEDDGASFQFATGSFLRTGVTRVASSTQTTFTIAQTGGSLAAGQRRLQLHLHAFAAAPSAVQLDGVAVQQALTQQGLDSLAQGWFYRASDHVLLVHFDVSKLPLQLVVTN